MITKLSQWKENELLRFINKQVKVIKMLNHSYIMSIAKYPCIGKHLMP